MVNFTDGNRYSDLDPKIYTVAAAGIGGQIAGKCLAKTGLLAMGLMLLKKSGVVLLLPLPGRRGFSRAAAGADPSPEILPEGLNLSADRFKRGW